MLVKVKRDVWQAVVRKVQNTAGHELAEGIKGDTDWIEDRLDGQTVTRSEYTGLEAFGRRGVKTVYYVEEAYRDNHLA